MNACVGKYEVTEIYHLLRRWKLYVTRTRLTLTYNDNVWFLKQNGKGGKGLNTTSLE